jgi:hypothetical protein
MFEGMTARIERLAEVRARARGRELAARLAEALPPGVQAGAEARGVLLSGKGLRRRIALDPALGQLIAGLLK